MPQTGSNTVTLASADIPTFKVYDDGFGYSLEWLENGKWKTSGTTWCATGRDIVKLNAEIEEIVKREDELRAAIREIISEIEG